MPGPEPPLRSCAHPAAWKAGDFASADAFDLDAVAPWSGAVGALSIHGEIAATRPDLLAPLCEGFPIDWGEEPPDIEAARVRRACRP